MSNEYFNVDTPIPQGSTVRSSQVNTPLAAIVEGFDKLPTPTDLKTGLVNFGTDSGSANSYVVTRTYPLVAYSSGALVNFVAANANTGPSTVNVDDLGVKNIKRFDGTELQIGDIPSGATIDLRYDGTDFRLQIVPLDVAAAQNWATLLDALVDETDYSAKEYAIGTTVAAGSAKHWATEAASSASNAATSETNAGASETNAGTSETNAAASASAAATSESNAATSETNAAASETAAAASAASIDLPSSLSGAALSFLRVLNDESGYELRTDVEVAAQIQEHLSSIPDAAVGVGAVTQHAGGIVSAINSEGGVDADTLDDATPSAAATADTVAVRDGSGNLTVAQLTAEADVFISGNALIYSSIGGAADAQGGDNIDHIWHEDSSNSFHFVSDGSYKDPGNSTLRAGNFVFEGDGVSAAKRSIEINAGNGLTGGGDLTANRTLTLGTPSTITSSTSNNVTSSSHTHAISSIDGGDITSGTINGARLPLGKNDISVPVLAYWNGSSGGLNHGDTVAASLLIPCNVNGGTTGATALSSGTYMCLSTVYTGLATTRSGQFLRVL